MENTQEQSMQGPGNPIMEVVSRIRSLEGKYNLLGERALIINQNMIEQYK